ncbi:PoNi-like cognate immunity protein [Herbaspirillum huttiense]|uniref:PoNi-like cognate immunity protein n=1 Tax=Herbaspirillum huttiense TaxID=863372 RepID=UPI002176C4F6|nr:PoNi-like cognate immunity protein [Herbaspirillum huttiense]UWE16386.1 PoNi-like cognate immunity protein [Herbaspirillum huttiense]
MKKPPSLLPPSTDFDRRKRQPLLFESYYTSCSHFYANQLTQVHEENILNNQGNPSWMAEVYASYAFDAFNAWQLRYTGGEDIAVLRAEFERVVCLHELEATYLREAEADAFFPAFDLPDLDDYVRYVALLSIAILLQQPELVVRLHALIRDSEFDRSEALVEELLGRYLPDRPYLDAAYHDHPYDLLLNATAGDSPGEKLDDLMEYLREWYRAMAPVGWYDGHRGLTDEGTGYHGYWSWEAGAIAYLHDIDDSAITSMYYPKDLVAYARSVAPPPPEGTAAAMTGRLRCEAGHVCPHSGWWSTPALGHELRSFRQGALMPEIDSNSWGLTIWYFDQANQPAP